MKIILHFALLSLSILGTATLLPQYLSIAPWWMVFIAGAALMFILTIVKPVISLLTLPINILTLGLFGLVINALFFLLLEALIPGFVVNGFVGALITSTIVILINWVLGKILKKD